MKKYIAICLLFLFSLAMPLSARTEEFYAEGYIKEDDRTIQVKDSMAVWDEEEGELRVYFYPFELTAKDLEENPGFIAFGKPSPDKKLWDWCPYGALSIEFEEPGNERKLENVNFINYILYGFTKKNYTMNINRNGKEARDSFDKFLLTGGEGQEVVTIATKGEYTSFSGESKCSWDLKVCTKIVVKE